MKKSNVNKINLISNKKYIAQLKAEIFQLKSLIDNLPGDIYWKDKDGAWLGVNIAGSDTLHKMGFIKNRSEVVGKTDYQLFKKETAEIFRAHDLEVMEKKIELKCEEDNLLPSGEKVMQLSTKRPLWNEKGEVTGIVGNTIDITHLKKMEASFNFAKSEFLRNMEHQLKTPICGIYSMVKMLARMETSPEKREILELTFKAAKEFLELLTHIIDVSRNQMENPPVLAKKFDLKQLVEKVVTMHKAAAKVKEIKLSYEYPGIPTIFISDPYRIQRLLVNLLSNSLRFTPEGSVKVSVVLAKRLNEKNLILQLMVVDTGIGIPLEKQDLIYEKFYRVYPANQNKYTGAGLGLYIVKQLIEELEGEIDVISSPGKGSTFICTLPLKRPLLDEIITG